MRNKHSSLYFCLCDDTHWQSIPTFTTNEMPEPNSYCHRNLNLSRTLKPSLTRKQPVEEENVLISQKCPDYDGLKVWVLIKIDVQVHTPPHTHRTHLVTLQSPSSSQGLLTDLAYFLEVELWQGMEPVGQLSEVEKLHLKPRNTDRQKGSKRRG